MSRYIIVCDLCGSELKSPPEFSEDLIKQTALTFGWSLREKDLCPDCALLRGTGEPVGILNFEPAQGPITEGGPNIQPRNVAQTELSMVSEWVARSVRYGKWQASDGLITEYIDMLQCFTEHVEWWRRYFVKRLRPEVKNVVVSGRSGAFIAGMLAGHLQGRGCAIYNMDKGYGLPWNGVLSLGGKVALLDDISVTGATLRRMEEWCDQLGLDVVQTLVGWPLVDLDQAVAKSLKQF